MKLMNLDAVIKLATRRASYEQALHRMQHGYSFDDRMTGCKTVLGLDLERALPLLITLAHQNIDEINANLAHLGVTVEEPVPEVSE